MKTKRPVTLIGFAMLFALASTANAGLWSNFKLKRIKKKLTSVKSLLINMEQKKIGRMTFQRNNAIILQTKHRKMRWHKLDKNLVPYIRIGCEREGGVMTTDGMRMTLNPGVIGSVYRGAVDPDDILKHKKRIRGAHYERFKRKAYNRARVWTKKRVAARNLVAVKQVEARFCVRKGRIVNGVFFFVDRDGYSRKIRNLYTVYLSHSRLMALLRPAYKSGMYAAYKYTRKLQKTVSFYDGRFDSKRGISRVYLEVNGSDEYVLRVNYNNQSIFPKTIKLKKKKFIKLGNRSLPIVTNIQESGNSDLKVIGDGCKLKGGQRIRMKSKSRCSMSVSVLVPGFNPRMRKIRYVVDGKEYELVPVSQYND